MERTQQTFVRGVGDILESRNSQSGKGPRTGSGLICSQISFCSLLLRSSRAAVRSSARGRSFSAAHCPASRITKEHKTDQNRRWLIGTRQGHHAIRKQLKNSSPDGGAT